MSRRVFILTVNGEEPKTFYTQEDLYIYLEVNEIAEGFTITKTIEE